MRKRRCSHWIGRIGVALVPPSSSDISGTSSPTPTPSKSTITTELTSVAVNSARPAPRYGPSWRSRRHMSVDCISHHFIEGQS